MSPPRNRCRREQDIVNLRLGQRIKVDDGTCPAGQIKEVSGSKMTSTGVDADTQMHSATWAQDQIGTRQIFGINGRVYDWHGLEVQIRTSSEPAVRL